ncbi:type II secretion system protein [Pseudoduganella violaceinigra]|uniref:type II secretion system protein n=1 Tax=Pseudoduganella violaceinigra TaxID=246602 RepID=UPI000419EDDE|nr:type II secretion system protein [Pseudoduganella violaceinigra]
MKPRSGGFTLLELMVTLSLLGIIAGAAMPLSQRFALRAKEAELRDNLREIRNALDAYKRATDEGKIEKKLGGSGYPANLQILVAGVPDRSTPDGKPLQFLRRIPRDPFFPDPAAAPEATWAQRAYASPADAPQAGEDVYDVMSLNQGTGLNGVPYREW